MELHSRHSAKLYTLCCSVTCHTVLLTIDMYGETGEGTTVYTVAAIMEMKTGNYVSYRCSRTLKVIRSG